MEVEKSAITINTRQVAAPPEAMRDEVVDVPKVPRNFEARKKWIVDESRLSVTPFAVASKNLGKVPSLENPRYQDLLSRANRLLTFLEHDFQVSPRYRDEANLSSILKIIFDDDRFHFPDDLKQRARALYEDFENNDWAAADVDDNAEEQPASPDNTGNTGNHAPVATVHVHIRLPPTDHPIWGIAGIMYGVCPKFGSRLDIVLDRRYLRDKRKANIFGHNGLRPGAWFPTQLVALFHGAHGASQAGISGNIVDGAYSVVVAGTYENIDKDEGDTIYYSGPNSQTHKDPNNPPGGAARYLERSLHTGRSVRVLRSANRKGKFAPSVGIRYDGLYSVTGRSEEKNALGGLIVLYTLKRQESQEALTDIMKRSPTEKQRHDFERIKDYW